MSSLQTNILVIGYLIVFLPMAMIRITSLVIQKLKPNQTELQIPKLLRGIIVGLYIGPIAIFPSIGAGLAIAGIWLGVGYNASIRNSGLYDTIIAHWHDLVFIALLSPVIGIVGLVCVFVKFMPIENDI